MVSVFDTRLPIRSGDFIGLDFDGTANYFDSAGPANDTRNAWFVGFLSDDEAPSAPNSVQTTNREVLVNADVEVDADNDGYGDETQDKCVGVAGPTCAPPCQNATKVGTSGNDVIIGTAGNDVISGLGGDDVIRGLGGDDVICGGDGNDKLKGGAGKDTLYGEAGRDKLNGGGAKDVCFGGLDKDAIGCEKAKQN